MTADEMARIMAQILGLWPDSELNDVQLDLWRRRLGDLAYPGVLQAVEQHRAKSQTRTPILDTILQLVPRPTGRREEPPFSEILRRQWSNAGDYAHEGLSAHDVLCRHYLNLWNNEKCSQSEGYRRSFRSKLRHSLFAEGCIEQQQLDFLVDNTIPENSVPS